MKIFFANWGFFGPREYTLKTTGAKRLVSYADPATDEITAFHSKEQSKPERKKKGS